MKIFTRAPPFGGFFICTEAIFREEGRLFALLMNDSPEKTQ
jgi:hypothetical protein